ncbi:MAG: hypothetical protein JW818_10450, partial [Pirellulales bacterium]|nr:hypothetical protein [Pirellulales bacterium]
DHKATLRFRDRRDNYSSVAFWYQDKPATNVPPMPPLEKRVDPETFSSAESLLRVAKPSKDAKTRTKFSRRSLGRRFFLLQAKGQGTSVTIPLKIKEKGRYSISIWLVGTPDGGVYRATLDGKTIVPRLDFYAAGEPFEECGRTETVRPVTERKLGLFYLDPGTHDLRFECTGRNPQSHQLESNDPAYNLGLNGLSFRKIPFEHMDQYLPEK